jgi:cyclophilin family peptidyl-prolyl cis-trans isomerase
MNLFKRLLACCALCLAVSGLATTKAGAAEPPIKVVIISTSYGDITLYLYDGTPKHRDNFLKLAAGGYFDGTTFHRVIKNFVVQGGDPNSKDEDPTNDGNGGPGYDVDAEINRNYFHKRGAIGAARNGDEMNPLRKSSGSQFYIVLGRVWSNPGLDSQQTRVQQNQVALFSRQYWDRPENQWIKTYDFRALQQSNPDSLQRLIARLELQAKTAFEKENKLFTFTPEERTAYTTMGGTPHLDANYTVFGEVLSGMEVAEAIAAVQKDSRDRPVQNIPMKVRVVEMDRKKFEATYKLKPR